MGHENHKRKTLKQILLLGLSSLFYIKKSYSKQKNSIEDIKDPIRLKMVTSFPKNLPGSDVPAQRLAKKIENMSNGMIKMKHYAAGELVPAFEVFDAVSNRVADCGVSAPYYWTSKDSSMPFFCSIPGGMTAKEIFVWLNQSNGQILWDKLYAKFNLKGLPIGNTGTTMGGWFKKPLNELSDFNGLKMRIPGLGGEVINRLGGIAVNISGGDVVNALKLGTIDAAEWAGPWPDVSMGFHKVANFYYGPGIHEPCTLNEFMINKEVWDNLSQLHKNIIINACYSNYLEGIAESFYNNARTLDFLFKKTNITIKNYPKSITTEMLEISKNILEEKYSKNPDYIEILSSYKKELNIYNRYHQYSDHSYLNLRI